MFVLVMLGCRFAGEVRDTDVPVVDPAPECVPSYGDHCDCYPKCLTPAQVEALDTGCAMACGNEGTGEPWAWWTCRMDDGQCVVVMP